MMTCRRESMKAKHNGFNVGKRDQGIASSWDNVEKNINGLHSVMKKFRIPIHLSDNYINYCRVRVALDACEAGGIDCPEECGDGRG